MPLIDYLRPDFPKVATDATGIRRTYLMRGPTATLQPLIPAINNTWSDGYKVTNTHREPIGTSSWSDVTVETLQAFEQAVTTQETSQEYPFWEIDQVQIEKSLLQHPRFISFSTADWAAVTAWEGEMDNALKAAFQYYLRDKDGAPTGTVQALTGTTSAGQKAFANLRLLGVESFLDFAPVVRKTSKYFGDAAPNSADAGQKTADAPTYAPSGYEWLKTADRVSKQGLRGNEWLRQEEWTGARKVLVDKDSLFT